MNINFTILEHKIIVYIQITDRQVCVVQVKPLFNYYGENISSFLYQNSHWAE
jgi:hypothetical protein